MPSGGFTLRGGDRLYVIGEESGLKNLCVSLGTDYAEAPTLRSFVAAERGEDSDLYSCAIAVEKGSELAGKTVRDSGIREKYDCMILGLQRSRLPILRPDVDMLIQPDDLVWVLGTRSTAEKLKSILSRFVTVE